ncbi:M29 family metallopeptidase [Phytohabitans suffuscus]|uniref:Leucyl aminopeptidase n=1 Tax=Phytohabitans suffuscus TaxID=624315 RepID=A0A6F8YDP6_9ACTN|nr:hypothetical protein [Phytohabitans suffuscus]BCB84226.1 hypothetical protein Psuf_015390 [Phytohabitans suffuscus]
MRRVPTNPHVGADLTPMFKAHLELCGIGTGDSVLAFTNTRSNESYVSALMAASALVGAEFLQLTVPAGNGWMESRAVVEAWKSSTLVVGLLASMDTHWIYSKAHTEALAAGAKTLMIEEPEDVLLRLFPTEELKKRGEFGGKLMNEAKEIRVTSEAGTDLVMSKEGRKGKSQWGFSDIPGRWDHWPSAFTSCFPLDYTAQGTLVIDAGDIVIPLQRYVQSPITCVIENGRIVSMTGEGADSRLLSDFFRQANDDRAYLISHIGWGNEHRAKWETLGLRFWEGGGVMDSEGYYGNMMIAFGASAGGHSDGTNETSFHCDIPTRNHDFYLDGRKIVSRGEFTIPDLVAPGRSLA